MLALALAHGQETGYTRETGNTTLAVTNHCTLPCVLFGRRVRKFLVMIQRGEHPCHRCCYAKQDNTKRSDLVDFSSGSHGVSFMMFMFGLDTGNLSVMRKPLELNCIIDVSFEFNAVYPNRNDWKYTFHIIELLICKSFHSSVRHFNFPAFHFIFFSFTPTWSFSSALPWLLRSPCQHRNKQSIILFFKWNLRKPIRLKLWQIELMTVDLHFLWSVFHQYAKYF